MPTQVITNPTGAFPAGNAVAGTTTSIGVGVYYTAVTSAAITTAPCAVAITTDGLDQVATAATNGTVSLVLGVALANVAAGSVVDVVTSGKVEAVPVAGAVAAGDVLKRSVTTAGKLSATATPAAGEAIAVALAASASNVVDVFVSKGFA